jgi:hypothetical protein
MKLPVSKGLKFVNNPSLTVPAAGLVLVPPPGGAGGVVSWKADAVDATDAKDSTESELIDAMLSIDWRGGKYPERGVSFDCHVGLFALSYQATSAASTATSTSGPAANSDGWACGFHAICIDSLEDNLCPTVDSHRIRCRGVRPSRSKGINVQLASSYTNLYSPVYE